jgi:hypothetical protein
MRNRCHRRGDLCAKGAEKYRLSCGIYFIAKLDKIEAHLEAIFALKVRKNIASPVASILSQN